MTYLLRLATLWVLASVGSASAVYADNDPASQMFRSPQSTAQVVSAVSGTGDLAAIPLALHIVLQPGWKTYWRAPGDAGYPPQIDVNGSTNVAKAELLWPVPHRFELFGLQTFGYGDEVAFPLMVTPQQAGAAISVNAKIRYLVCEQICVPQDATLALDLPGGVASPSEFAPLVNRFASLVPKGADRLGWSVEQVAADNQNQLVVNIRSNSEVLNAPDVIVEGAPHLYFGPPKVELSADRHGARMLVPMERLGDGPDATATDLTLTIFDGERGLETTARPVAITGIVAPLSTWTAILPILAVALLGGLILNVMPCVLPVLLLKLTSVLDVVGRERAHLRGAFLSTAAGIVSSFLVLAGGLIAVKSAGATIGWGIQFQQPAFLAIMALVCLLFAANIWGLFQIPMPAFVGRAAVASDARIGNEHGKSFFTGVLATALATPCSAPFVGTAVAFALARGATEIVAIFLALGIGLALPYLAVAAAPALVGYLPRPGRWMRWLKGLLGLTLVGTAIWLGSIGALQAGFLNSASLGNDGKWVAFDEAAIAGQVDAGKVVFVDVTADWCITCQANKKLVMDQDAFQDWINRPDVVAMRADWTKPDQAIADFLARHGRYGIPFNIVYGPGAPAGIALPELLTGEAVVAAFDQAAKR